MHKTTFKIQPEKVELEFSCKTAEVIFTANTEEILEQIDAEVIAEYLKSLKESIHKPRQE